MEINIEEEMHLDDMDVHFNDEHFNTDVQSRAAMMHTLFGSDSDDESHFQNDGCNDDDGLQNLDDGLDNVPVEAPMSNDDVNGQENVHFEAPQQGMIYDSFDSIFNAYQEYARQTGFSVLKRVLKNSKYALMACDKSRVPITQKSSKRIGCPARLNAIRKDDGFWVISKTIMEHNHDLDPTMSILMPAHRKIDVHMKRLLEANDIADIRPSKNIRLCEMQAGGPDKIGCIPRDCRNFIDDRRRFRLGVGDAEAIRKLFARLQHRDRNFFHLIDIDDEGRLRNVLWIHPRSRAAYEYFNDVVSFDTTYLVNRYEMPFGAFVGVNHHGQSILLGCALLTPETIDSFKWLFENWIEAMGGVHPKAIITDQCESIKGAVRDVLQNTFHRYCLWHIMSKLPQRFKGLAEYNRAISEFKGIVYDSITISNFETRWNDFLVKYGMQSNTWLQGLYDEKEKWVPVYLRHIFWAGMLSTQRSEGMHAYFDDYMHSRCSLKEFMEQYEVAIGKKIQKEFIADFESKNKVKKCKTHYHWEKQFRDAFTNNMFLKFQEEIDRMVYCHIVPALENDDDGVVEDGVQKFYVLDRSLRNNFRPEFTYKVEYRADGEYLNCQCHEFEFRGLLCCHILTVMTMKDIRTINERYVHIDSMEERCV
ncbi:hypothetical protein ACS0TY_033483 [Phlomoides rotata]